MASILVCEDDQRIRDILIFQLKKGGHVLESAVDGNRGLERALAEPFDLIISDLNMPGLNGVELAGALQKAGKATKLVVLTAFVTGDLVDKVRSQPNVAKVVSKPWDTKQLLEAVEEALA
ncbi:MAG: response regulator [Planctomycetota bacterium]